MSGTHLLRPWSPHIDPATIPDAVLYSEVGRRRGAKRPAHAHWTKGKRRCTPCPCGKMSVERAGKRGHKCATNVVAVIS